MLRIIRMADSISLIPCQVNHSSFIFWCMYFQRDLYGSDTMGSFHAGSKMKRWLCAGIFSAVRNISHSSVTKLRLKKSWSFMVMTSPDVPSVMDHWWLIQSTEDTCCVDHSQLNIFLQPSSEGFSAWFHNIQMPFLINEKFSNKKFLWISWMFESPQKVTRLSSLG